MKGKTILQVAAWIITTASIVSFNLNKHISGHRVYGTTRPGSLNCTASTCFTNASGLCFGKCHTVLGGVKTAFTGRNNTMYTCVTRILWLKCSGPIRVWTHNF